jgi:biopolymer transport protein TolQ
MQLSGNIESEIFKLIATAGIVAKIILLILFIFSIFSWAVIFFKLYQIRRADKGAREFLELFSKVDSLNQLRHSAEQTIENPLSAIFKEGYNRFLEIKNGKSGLLSDRTAFLNAIDRRLKGTIEDETSYYEGYLSFLATTGNVTPFIGLFGTVWGIIHAFQQIGFQGTANIAAVAPGIAEALITTASGLATAVPAVIGYNYLLNRLRKLSSKMEVFTGEFMAFLEAEIWSLEKDVSEVNVGSIFDGG